MAWREMERALPDDGVSCDLLATCLDAVHGRKAADSLDAHLRQFTREIAIWRAASRQLAAPLGRCGAALVDRALTEFCLAWRMIDDIQNLDEDRASGQDNSVRLVTDTVSAARRDALRGIPAGAVPHPVDPGWIAAVERVLAHARRALARAGAAAAGLPGWAEDIAMSREILTLPAAAYMASRAFVLAQTSWMRRRIF